MKRKILIFTALVGFTVGSTFASVTVEETTDAEYLINSGYSQAVAEDVFIVKNRANGKTIEPLYEKPQSPFVKGWFKFWAYVDPARDETDRIHHDIHLTPSYEDL